MRVAKIQLTVVNRLDEISCVSREITSDQVRQVTLPEVRINPMVTFFGLPTSKIAELGLTVLREVMSNDKDGIKPMRVFQDAKIFLGDRVGVFQCLELPEGNLPMLGRIPMLELGLGVDSLTNELVLLPEPHYRS